MNSMVRHVAALAGVILLGLPLPVNARHGGLRLDARHASPGVQLTLVEAPPSSPSATIQYQLRAAGFTSQGFFDVWAKEFGAAFQPVRTKVRVAEDGLVVTAGPSQWEPLIMEPGPYPGGAIWEVGLVSTDGTIMAFAQTIPRPIAARDGACKVSLELASRRGDKFLASSSGFLPAEEVTIESSSGGRTMQKRQKAGANGQLPPDVVTHWPGAGDHRAHYAVRGRRCDLLLDYEWGDRALVRR